MFFAVFPAALSSLERPGGGWSVWGGSAGSTGHCVGRGSASASPVCPWFVPFPAHSYVIICDTLLGSQATKSTCQSPGLLNKSSKDAHAHTGTGRCMNANTFRATNVHSHTRMYTNKLWGCSDKWFMFHGAKGSEGIILATTLTLSKVQHTSLVPVVPSTFPSNC